MRLILTMGLPYSGKTTWALKQNLPVVSPDAVRLALHGERFLSKAEPWVWTTAHTMVDALSAAGHPAVIVDATHVKAKRRQEWIDRHPGALIEVAEVRTNIDECMDRALEAGDDEIQTVIYRQEMEYEPLEESAGMGLPVRFVTIHRPEESP